MPHMHANIAPITCLLNRERSLNWVSKYRLVVSLKCYCSDEDDIYCNLGGSKTVDDDYEKIYGRLMDFHKPQVQVKHIKTSQKWNSFNCEICMNTSNINIAVDLTRIRSVLIIKRIIWIQKRQNVCLSELYKPTAQLVVDEVGQTHGFQL